MAPKDPTDKISLSPNYTKGWPKGAPMGITIHTEEGYHGPSVSWLRNRASGASAHFCVRRDGFIEQLVWEQNRAWHARGSGMYYFGIEHEGGSGYGKVPILWKTAKNATKLAANDHMLIESARLSAYLCTKYGIPVQHDFTTPPRRNTTSRIAGHDQMAGNDHVDPYSYFPWRAYINKVNEFLSGRAPEKKPAKPDVLYRVQLGAFSKPANAKRLENRLERAGYDAFVVKRGGYYRTQTGAFSNKNYADALARELKRKGFDTFVDSGKADGGGSPPDGEVDMRTSYPRERISAHINFDAWMPAAERAAREVSDKFQPRSLNSYPGHGGEPRDALAKGNSTSVDYFVCPWTHRPSKAQGQKRIAMAKYVIKHRKRMPVKYAISGGYIWTHKRRRWVKYDPSFYNLWHPKDNYWSKMHFEHLHVTYLWD